MANISVLGAGGWGIALAILLDNNGNHVTLWSALEKEVQMIQEKRENEVSLKGIHISEDIQVTGDLDEAVTNQVGELLKEQGIEPYILSTEACAICERCAILDGKPCRFPEKMHPCVESHGINVIPTLESCGLEFQYGDNIVTWFSLLFFN